MSTLPEQFYYKNNRLQQLRGFYYTVRYLSFSKAAQHMKINQSAVTMQIKSLERDLNLRLLNRDKNGISLTEEGRKFYYQACPYIEGIDSLYERFYAAHKEDVNNRITLATNNDTAYFILPKLINKLNTLQIDIKINIKVLDQNIAFEKVATDEIDLALYPGNIDNEEFETHKKFSFKTVIATSKNHPLAAFKTIDLETLSEYEILRIFPHHITIPLFDETLSKNGIKSGMICENSNYIQLLSLVRENIGITIMPNFKTKDFRAIHLIDLSSHFPATEYKIVSKRKKILSVPIKNFLKIIA